MKLTVLLASLVLLAGSVAFVLAGEEKSGDEKCGACEKSTTCPSTQPVADNKKCPVSGDDVDPKSKTVAYKGKTVGFCCDECIEKFEKNPDKYAGKLK
jgi:YHS domain-containing protein